MWRSRATTQEKLKLLLSQLLLKCAKEMPANVDLLDLCLTFRKDHELSKILRRAKALLAVRESYFEHCPYPKEPQSHETLAEEFSRVAIEAEPKGMLTMNECHETFTAFCASKGVGPMGRKRFVGLMLTLCACLRARTSTPS